MNLKQALKRIEVLEEQVRTLQAQPREVHYHNDFATPAYPPSMLPYDPHWPTTITCGGIGSQQ